jgi:hydrogenase nickel incorporation protein HypA/HybF
MHETHMAQSIVSAASSRAKSSGASSVKAVRVQLGKWTCIDPDSLRNAFAAATAGTLAAGADLEIEVIEPSLRCEECRAVFEGDSKALRCVKCGSARVVLQQQADMQVQRMDFD